ncbi:MAG: HIT domain-containing protein [Bacteriovoracaceae bacterium]|nr:HIT domain-containing protein [Bacteriovoracaceae bacterium]
MIKGEIPVDKVFENESVLGFRDIHPQAKDHFLFISKLHTENINHLTDTHTEQLGEVFSAIKLFSENNDLAGDGFRVVTNMGKNGGQTVFHTHFHVLGGEPLGRFGR